MSSRDLSQGILDFRDSPLHDEQTLTEVFYLDGERLGNPEKTLEIEPRGNHGNHRKRLGPCSELPPQPPGKTGSPSQVSLIKYYLVILFLASKQSRPLEVLCLSTFPAGPQ